MGQVWYTSPPRAPPPNTHTTTTTKKNILPDYNENASDVILNPSPNLNFKKP
jgi:hypothetical protein